MAKLSPLTDLTLQATKWLLAPGNNRDALGKAGLDVAFPRPFDPWSIQTLPEVKALADLAIAISSCPRGALRASVTQLRPQLALAQAEIDAWRRGQAQAQDQAERKRFGAPAPELPHDAIDPWKERADL